MKKSDLEALAQGLAPVVRDLVHAKTRPLEKRLEWLEREVDRLTAEEADQRAKRAVEG